MRRKKAPDKGLYRWRIAPTGLRGVGVVAARILTLTGIFLVSGEQPPKSGAFPEVQDMLAGNLCCPLRS